MEVRVGKLGCGATVNLIKACSEAGGQYVVSSVNRIQEIIDMAGNLGAKIRIPITIKAYLNLKANSQTGSDRYFFDIGDLLKGGDVMALYADRIFLLEVQRHVTSSYTSREL